MDTLRITYKSTNQRKFTSVQKKIDMAQLSISSDLFPGIFTYLWLGSPFQGISIIRYHHTAKRLLQTLFLSLRSPTVHSFSQSLAALILQYFLPALRVKDNDKQRDTLSALLGAPMYVQSSLGKCLVVNGQVLLRYPWLLGYLTRAATIRKHGLAA